MIEIKQFKGIKKTIMITEKKDKDIIMKLNEYWSLHGHKYVEKRRKDDVYKLKQSEYYRNYREMQRHIYPNNFF